MFKAPTLFALIVLASVSAFGQKSNQQISGQLKSLKADKQISVNYDGGGKTSKLLLIGENFSDSEAKTAGIQAMNFGMAVNYAGESLAASPDPILFTLWVLTKKPRFAENSHLVVTLPSDSVDLGDSKYAAKAASNMEYLNFTISRDQLTKIANQPNARFRIGKADFTFTQGQLQSFRNFLAASEVK